MSVKAEKATGTLFTEGNEGNEGDSTMSPRIASRLRRDEAKGTANHGPGLSRSRFKGSGVAELGGTLNAESLNPGTRLLAVHGCL